MFGGGGFDRDTVGGEVKICGDVLYHRRNIGEEFGRLGNDGDIDVYGAEVALLADDAEGLTQELTRVCALVARISIRKMVADVTEGSRAQEGVAEGVEGHVGIAVAEETAVVWDFYAAQY